MFARVDLFRGSLTKGSDAGDSRCTSILASIYQNGDGVTCDSAKAYAYWQKAAEQGDSEAFANLGFAHCEGGCASHDEQKAIEYFDLAYKGGSSIGAYMLGNL